MFIDTGIQAYAHYRVYIATKTHLVISYNMEEKNKHTLYQYYESVNEQDKKYSPK